MVTVLERIPHLHEKAVSCLKARSLAVITGDELEKRGRSAMVVEENVLREPGNLNVMLTVQAIKSYRSHRSNTFDYLEGQELYKTLMYLVIRPTEPLSFTIYVVENPEQQRFDSQFAIYTGKNTGDLYQFFIPNTRTRIQGLEKHVHEVEMLTYPIALDIMAGLFYGYEIRALMKSWNVPDTNERHAHAQFSPPAQIANSSSALVPPSHPKAYATHPSSARSPTQGMPSLQQGAYAQMPWAQQQLYPANVQIPAYPANPQIPPYNPQIPASSAMASTQDEELNYDLEELFACEDVQKWIDTGTENAVT